MRKSVALTLLLAACTGEIRGERGVAVIPVGKNDRPGQGRPGPGPSPDEAAFDPHIGRHHGALGLRRLTRFEYASTVQDLLGVTGVEAEIPSDESVAFLPNNQNAARVGQADVEAYERLAGKVAERALEGLALPEGCALATVDAGCLGRWLPDFLLRAFRRPAEGAEIERYAQLHGRLVAAGATAADALRGVLEAVLISPSFLYRSELPAGQGLSPWDVASRLSYFLWGTLPDAELFTRARDGSLTNADERRRQVRRMLRDSRAERGILNWIFEWYGLVGAQLARKGKDVLGGLPALAAVQSGIEEETRRFVTDALLGEDGSFERLYTATSTHLNDAVAAIYGLREVTGREFRKVDLDARTRRGLFTQPLLFVAHAKESGYSVVQMGRFVRERLLCQEVPPPPENVDTTLDEGPAMAGLTYREKLSQHAESPACRGCHQMLDPPGFAYLAYDPIGRHVPKDPSGRPFDTSGEFLGLGARAPRFADAVTMLDAIAASREAKGCFARKLIEHTFGRTLAPADLPLARHLLARIEARAPFSAVIGELVAAPEFVAPGPLETNP